MGDSPGAVQALANTVANCTTHAVTESHDNHTAFIAAFLLLVMIALALNLGHYLKHKNFTYLSETAIYILFGTIFSFRFVRFRNLDFHVF
jgi:hypothetical protein